MAWYSNAERPSSLNNVCYVRVFQFVPFKFMAQFPHQVKYCSHLPVRSIRVHGLISTPGQILWRYTRSLCLCLDIQCLKTKLYQQPTQCLHFPVHSIHVLGLIVPWVQYCWSTQGHNVYVYWKIPSTRPVCLWPAISMLKDPIQSTNYTILTSSNSCPFRSGIFPQVQYYGSTQGHSVMVKYSNVERPSSINKVHYIHIFQFVPCKFLAWFPHQLKYYESIQGHCTYGPTFSAERPSSVTNLQNVHIFQFMPFTFMA